MLTRDFNMNTIAAKTNDIKTSIGDIFGNTKEALNKKYGTKNLPVDIIPDDPEVQKRVKSFCTNNRYSKTGGDWLGKLNRDINKDGRLNLCSDGKKLMGEGDTLISMASKLRSGVKFDPSSMIGNFASNELASLGITNVPKCLTDSLFNALKGAFGLPGGLIPKLDMSKILNNACLKDTLNFGINNADSIMKAATIQTMADQNEDAVIKSYVFKNGQNDPNGTRAIIESNLSKTNGSNVIKQMNLIDSGTAGRVDKGNLLNNVNNEINSNNSSVFNKLNDYYDSSDAMFFKGNKNLSNSAASFVSNKASSDKLSVNQKTTLLDSSSLSLLSNAFI